MMHQSGLTKLVEECGELVQVAAKKMAYSEEGAIHPDGAGDLNERIENEMGDVLAAIYFVSAKLNLDFDRIENRQVTKMCRYRTWDEDKTT